MYCTVVTWKALFHWLAVKSSKGFPSRTMRHVNSRSSRFNSPGEALHVGASSVALRPPVPNISEITHAHTHIHVHLQRIRVLTLTLLVLMAVAFMYCTLVCLKLIATRRKISTCFYDTTVIYTHIKSQYVARYKYSHIDPIITTYTLKMKVFPHILLFLYSIFCV